MNRIVAFAFAIISLSCSKEDKPQIDKYINGYVFNGETFIKKDFYVQDGLFKFKLKHKPNRIIDLEDTFIVPPFGDAHTHNFDDLKKFDSIYNAYLNEGVFYVQVLNNHYSNYLKINDSIDKRNTIDVAFAHGGITSTGGHPHNLYESQALNLSWRAMFDPAKKEKLLQSLLKENDAYYLIDDIKALEKKWESIINKKPDFLKIYILNSGDRLTRIKNKQIGSYGVSIEVLKAITVKAQKAGLKLIAHVETIKDFEIALENGIVNFAHMPGYGGGIGNKELSSLTLSDSLVRSMSTKNVTITPTVSFTKYYAQVWDGTKMVVDSVLLKKKKVFIKDQLRKLYDNNINITLGADQNNTTLTEEIDDIIDINIFSNLELLNILTSTGKSIFPNRQIGKIETGYEANFLILKENPIMNIETIKHIQGRVKNGIELNH